MKKSTVATIAPSKKARLCYAPKDGEVKRGIYTGKSPITHKYYVSFFDGSTGVYTNREAIMCDNDNY